MKFIRKFYRWSLIIIIPLLIGSSIRGCEFLNLLSWFLCYNPSTVGVNDETYYQVGDFYSAGHYIFVTDSGKILNGSSLDNNGCFQTLNYDFIIPETDNSLNRVEYIQLILVEKLLLAVGDNGTILLEDDPDSVNTFNQISSPTNNNLNGICTSLLTIFVVGDAGTVIKSVDEGVTWELLNFPYNVDLNDCSSPSPGEVICVGSSYFAAYRTTDYGDTWEQINFGDLVPESFKSKQGAGLQRIYCYDNNISYIIGAGLVF